MTSLPSPGQFREAVIDLGAISHNVRTLRERVGTPNYLAVVAEGIALPLAHSAWITALVFTALNAVLLRTRIGIENSALARLA